MHRYELSDRQWDRIASFFPHRTHDGNVGHPFNPEFQTRFSLTY
jgi:hypothetical protein